jgi:hypothetical protein
MLACLPGGMRPPALVQVSKRSHAYLQGRLWDRHPGSYTANVSARYEPSSPQEAQQARRRRLPRLPRFLEPPALLAGAAGGETSGLLSRSSPAHLGVPASWKLEPAALLSPPPPSCSSRKSARSTST